MAKTDKPEHPFSFQKRNSAGKSQKINQRAFGFVGTQARATPARGIEGRL